MGVSPRVASFNPQILVIPSLDGRIEADQEDFGEEGQGGPQSAKEAFAEVMEFGNPSEATSTGRYAYRVKISEIDTPELLQKVKEILGDKKMHLPSDEVMSSLKEGVVVLKRVNPVKAYKIIRSLFSEPLKLEWEQYEIHSHTP